MYIISAYFWSGEGWNINQNEIISLETSASNPWFTPKTMWVAAGNSAPMYYWFYMQGTGLFSLFNIHDCEQKRKLGDAFKV